MSKRRRQQRGLPKYISRKVTQAQVDAMNRQPEMSHHEWRWAVDHRGRLTKMPIERW